MASLENFRLTVFRAVAGHLSFRKAAEALFLTQPAVSQQIKALEEELGAQLFTRGGAQVTLTTAGELLLGSARDSEALLRQTATAIAALSGGFSGRLALGASTTIAQYVLPRLLGEFLQSHPKVEATLISGNTEAIVEALITQKLALGMIEGPARRREIQSTPFLLDELALIVPAGEDWGAHGPLSVQELAKLPLLQRERGSGTRRIVEQALEQCGLRRGDLRVAMELDSTEAIKSAVAAGLGAGFVSRCALAMDARLDENACSSLRIVAVQDLQIERSFTIASLKGPEEPPLAAEFRRFLLTRCNRATVAARAPKTRRPRR